MGRRLGTGAIISGLLSVGLLVGTAWADQKPADGSLQSFVTNLLDFIKTVQDTTYKSIGTSYQEQIESLYGEQEGFDYSQFMGALGLPDTFSLGLSLTDDSNSDPFNLGPYAPRTLIQHLVARESNRALTRATQTDRLSGTNQEQIKSDNDELHSRLQDSADRAVTAANTASSATSTQDTLKQVNQQLALVNSSIVSTSLESLKLQTDFAGGLGNLQMLISDVGEAFDEQVRERYYLRSQQALGTAASTFEAGETLARQPLNSEPAR